MEEEAGKAKILVDD